MASAVQPLLSVLGKIRKMPQEALDAATGEPYLHPLWQMLGLDPPDQAAQPPVSGMLPYQPAPQAQNPSPKPMKGKR